MKKKILSMISKVLVFIAVVAATTPSQLHLYNAKVPASLKKKLNEAKDMDA